VKFNDLFKKPILINLDRRQDRLEEFDRQAKELGITYRRFEAIEATEPILGCKLSHIAALSMCKDQIAFVFEDDSIFVEDFQNLFAQAMDTVPSDWDMLYFGAHLIASEKVNDQWRRSLECSSTHAYAVKTEVIPKLIKAAMSHSGHVDVAYATLHKDIKAYAARPTLIYQGATYSDLQNCDVDYKYLYF
jgi:GR25 family glycosyltransferase involved in LPS biosynthesis